MGTKLLNGYNEYTGDLKSLFKHVLKKKNCLEIISIQIALCSICLHK